MLRLKVDGDLNLLLEESMSQLMNNPKVIDATQTPRLLTYDNILQASSCEFSYDLCRVGFTKVRWPRYCHHYLDKDKLREWIDSLKIMSDRGDSLFRSNDMNRRPRDHKYGSCWIALSFRKTPPTLILYSRVAEFPTRAVLELTMVHKVAKEIESSLIVSPPIAFTWFISSAFLSCLHLVPYLAQRKELDSTLKRTDNIGHFIRHQLDHIKKGNVKYGPTRRMAKRVEQINNGTLLKVPIKELNLWV